MFQLIATIVTSGCILWMAGMQPAHAALTSGPAGKTSISTIAQPIAGATLSVAANLPEGFDFAETAKADR